MSKTPFEWKEKANSGCGFERAYDGRLPIANSQFTTNAVHMVAIGVGSTAAVAAGALVQGLAPSTSFCVTRIVRGQP